jgi:hypothetical protein
MAADGSLKFDTKVNTEGFDAGMSTLTKAVERLSGLIEDLSKKMDGGFTGAGNTAASTAKDIDTVAESAKKAREEVERLNKEKAATFTGTITNNNASPSSIPDDGKRYDIYGNDVDEIIARNKTIEESAREAAAAENKAFEEAKQGPTMLQKTLEILKRTISDIPTIASSTGHVIMGAFNSGNQSVIALVDKIDLLKEHLYSLEKSGSYFGDPEYDKTYGELQKAIVALNSYKKELEGTRTVQKKVDSSGKKMNKTLAATNKTAIPLTKSILKLSNMFKLMLIRMAMRAAIKAAKEGFENLAQYSDETNKSISMLVSANTRLKNSFATAFAPALDAAAPALKEMIDLLSTGATYAGQLVAALTGKATFVKAVDVEENYGEALKDSNSELKKKEKLNQKLAFSFDDLIQAQEKSEDGYIGPTPDQMFETVEIENDIKDFADVVKRVFSDLFDPMKQSWLENGPEVNEAVHAALNSMKNLAMDVGTSFLQVWKNESYGQKITDDLLITFANLAFTAANLCDQLDKAWTSGDLGVSIMRHLGDLVLEVTGFFREASEAIRDWSAGLDFYPLLSSFDEVLVSLRPIVSKIGDVLLWLLTDILLPIAKWGIENGIPAAFDLISAALKALNSILEALKPLAIWLWEDFLQPFGEWTGKIIIEALKKVTEWLTKFSDWISEHEEEIRFAAVTVAGFFMAWKAIEFVEKVKNIIDVLSGANGFIGILKLLNKNLDTTQLAYLGIASAIGILLGAVYEIYKNWDNMTVPEKVISSIMAAASAITILAVALGAATGGAAKAALIAGAIALGIGAAMVAVNAGKRSSAGAYSSGSYSPYNAYSPGDVSSYRMPRLATGTVVPPRAGEFAAILGDNNRETEVVSPLSTIEQALDNVMAKYMGEGGNRRPMQIDLIVNGQRFARAVYEANNQEKQRVGVRMVTEG